FATIKVLTHSFLILQVFGGWIPISCSSTVKEQIYNIYTLIIGLTMITFFVSCTIDLFYTYSNIEIMVQNLSMTFTVFVAWSKLVLLKLKRSEVRNILRLLDGRLCRVQREEEAGIQFKHDKKAKDIIVTYFIMVGCAVSFMTTASILDNLSARVLPFNGWFPFQHLNGSGFWIAYFHQSVAHFYVAMVGSAFDTVFWGVLIQNSSQLVILKSWLESFVNIVHRNKTAGASDLPSLRNLEHKFMKKCIHHHWIILQLSFVCKKQANDRFSPIIFRQYSLSLLILCMSVQLLTKLAFGSPEFMFIVFYLCCMISQIFLFCWYANEVALESSEISSAIYNMDWQYLMNKTKKDLLLMKMRTVKPIKFTSGSLIELSLESFTKLMKFSYTAYNVLQRK
ncbi:LOW QUALITY PROTEIN: odorant receptor 10-like, partial [Cotesia typhae]|uniref:LOW QUALITY PROTEIN: odorant receptor 10-like n=1 Tax=Cotesia typhae TaxID=2053667 RepID=UPI003D695260